MVAKTKQRQIKYNETYTQITVKQGRSHFISTEAKGKPGVWRQIPQQGPGAEPPGQGVRILRPLKLKAFQ